ncbi:uncharacterized protein LOC129726644 [Wyeomyia smithii]|uniref:uncharacterized protein LOC129726644 n=1 Tax=Wyeomyia smithii TaxID=174621 RepID=UPI0024680E96|nr:uncharacterized protein LOC129726644 [Wyeomyia smithii]
MMLNSMIDPSCSQMFAVAQFFEKQQLRVLAVPVSWMHDGYLMWPKLPSNDKLEKLRTGGIEFHGSTKKIPAIMGRKYKSLQAAEAAAEDLLKQEVSDIEAKRKLLKHRRNQKIESRPPKDYNKMIQLQTLSHQGQIPGTEKNEPPRHLLQTKDFDTRPMGLAKPTISIQTEQSLDPGGPGTCSIIMPQQSQPHLNSQNKEGNANSKDVTSAALLELSDDQPAFQSIFLTDENIIYINPPSNSSGAAGELGNPVDSLGEITSVVTSLKSNITELGSAVTTSRTEVTDMRNEMIQMKLDIIEGIKTSIRQVVEDCLDKSFPRFATMLHMDCRDESKPQAGNSIEEHRHINDKDDLINFNKMLANKHVFEEYIKYFTKIIPPTSYYAKGDSACYIIVDCLFTRPFWNNFTWTGINRGNKSKRGFREFANVLQLLFAIVSIGDPTYTRIKLESFCKNRLFRYSKARSSSKQLRRSTCRRTRVKGDEAVVPVDGLVDDDNRSGAYHSNQESIDAAVVDDVEDGDGLINNITADSTDHEESDEDSHMDIDMASRVEVLIN